MFNKSQHYADDFGVIFELSPEDYAIYQTAQAKFKARFPWSPALSRLFDLCLVHTSEKVPGKIVYYASIENLRLGRGTQTSPEMFFERWLNCAPQHIQHAWQTEVMGKIMPTVKFVPNTNPDEWFRVYNDGPYSCMQGSSLVRQYCHPENNLSLAYIEKDNSIIARTIVNTKTLAWVRIFGKKDNVLILSAALRGLGYGHDADQALGGEAIYLDWADCANCGDNILIGPYLDSDDQRLVRGRDDGTKTGVIGHRGEGMHNNEGSGGNYYCSESCSEDDYGDDDDEE